MNNRERGEQAVWLSEHGDADWECQTASDYCRWGSYTLILTSLRCVLDSIVQVILCMPAQLQARRIPRRVFANPVGMKRYPWSPALSAHVQTSLMGTQLRRDGRV